LKVVGRKVLTDFADHHADVRSQIKAWFAEAEEAIWRTPQDIKNRYPHASILAGNRVVFNLKGKKYRLLVRVQFDFQIVRVVRLGTHAEYTTWEL
jgi:mRNA interferase HigB